MLPAPAGAEHLLVQPRTGLALPALAAALAARGYDVRPAPALAGAARVRVPAGADPAALAARLAASGLARGVEADLAVVVARLPDDPRYPRQAPYMEAIRAPEAWEVETGDPRVVVAVVDSGVDLSHPDLAPRLALNFGDARFDGRDEDGSGCPDDFTGCSFVTLETADPSCGYRAPPPHRLVDDDEGHGSFVAGVAAAAGDNGIGVTGVAWDVRILPVKVLDCTATGRIADAAAGIRYAAGRGADVINVSFGSRRDSAVLREAVEAALAAGAVVVASAGNEGAAPVTYPAAYPGVIAVGASGAFTERGVDYTRPAEFSNTGPEVALLAPGRLLLSTLPAEQCGRRGWLCEDGPYALASGTSFATPLVSGAAALLRSRHPGLAPPLVRALLVGSARPTLPGEPGLLDVAAALERPLFRAGLPGTSRAGGGAPAGPAERSGPSSGGGAQPPAAPTPRVPRPADTGHGLHRGLPRRLPRRAPRRPPGRPPGRAHPSTPSRRRAAARSS